MIISYTNNTFPTWLGKQHAIENIFGNWEKSYNKLPGMLQSMQMYVFFFLKNLRRYVTSKDGLCLILDRHEAIRSTYSKNGSGWIQNNYVMFIALYTLHSKRQILRVITFDESNTRFLVEETQHLGEVQPVERFTIRLEEIWYDCGKFQKVYIPCSHVLASCLNEHHDYESYISLIYTLQQVAKVYK
uniref:Uncharacterized protein n=1 Tax=Cajanus cajan TaxID=3821 RepID=A0A151S1P3_CAJCA|nr:hypothetical protein KK1_029535 [Cajanus cajan]